MPIINPERCYELTVPKQMAKDVTLDLDFFALLILKQTGASQKYRLEYHLGKQATYSAKSNLIASMLTIQAYLQATHNSDDEKIMIIDKLSEGLDTCTAGFHDRLNSILLGLMRPQHIDEFLEKIRIGIVDAVARRLSADVHQHNRIFTGAARQYGVRPINSEDFFSIGVLSKLEERKLEDAFRINYTALSIIGNLKTQIEGELRTYYGYVGLNNEGYTSGVYLKIIDFFNVLFAEVLDVHKLFILNEHEVPLDIDWFALESILVNFLHIKGYLWFSEEELYFYETLYQQNEESLSNLLEQEEFVSLLFSFNFLEHPELLKHIPPEKKAHILNTIVFCSKYTIPFSGLEQYLRKIEAVCEEKLKKQCKQRVILIWLTEEKNREEFYTMFGDKRLKYKVISLFPYLINSPYKAYPNVLEDLFLSFLSSIAQTMAVIPLKEVELRIPLYELMLHYSEDQLFNALKDTLHNGYQQRVFDMIVFDFPSVPVLLLKKIGKIEQSHQSELLRAKNEFGSNVISYSCIYQPRALSFLFGMIPKGEELELLQIRNPLGQDLLMNAAGHHLLSLNFLLHQINQLPFLDRCEFFSTRPLRQYRDLKYKDVIKMYVDTILSEQLLKLDSLDPYDSAIKKVMMFLDNSESDKKFAIYSAYYKLISKEGDKKSLIQSALADTSSALYKAFRINVSYFSFSYSLFGVIPALQVFKAALDLCQDDPGLDYLQSGLF